MTVQAEQVEETASISNVMSADMVSDADSNQYLTFIMAGEEYGVDILCVQEIRGWDSATPLPNSPAHIKGVINLRGTIVPIVDMRQCFGLDESEYTAITVVIVLKIEAGENSRIVGIVVDAVSDVYTIKNSDMKSAPDLGDSVDTDYIHGLVEVNETMVILLKMDKLLNLENLPDISGLSSMAGEQANSDKNDNRTADVH